MDLTKVLSVVKSKKQDFSQLEFYLEQQVSKHCPARMRKNFTPTAPQLFFVQRKLLWIR